MRSTEGILTEKHRPRRLKVVDIYNFKTFNNPNNFCLVLKGRTGEGTRQKAKDETKNTTDKVKA